MKQSIITPLQNKFLKSFFQTHLGEKFFLTGGTALAGFYLGHRFSQDLDLFTLDQDLNFDEVNAEIRKIAFSFGLTAEHRVSTSTFSQFFLKTKKSEVLKIDIVREVPLQFGKPVKKNSIWVDSLENISVNKLLAIYGRLEAKDYIDLYFLIKGNLIDFEQVFRKGQKKDAGLNKFYFASMIASVTTFKHFPKTLKPFDKEKLVDFYLKMSEKMLKEIKPE